MFKWRKASRRSSQMFTQINANFAHALGDSIFPFRDTNLGIEKWGIKMKPCMDAGLVVSA
jgi:hypothetical protein